MDPFAVILLVGFAGLIAWVWILGRFFPGSGLEQLGLKEARQITENREALEAEDLDQMIAARNARRRARGEQDVSLSDYELGVHADLHDHRRRQEALRSERAEAEGASRELDQLLEATNARRRARGLPERSAADARREFDSPARSGPSPAPGRSEPPGRTRPPDPSAPAGD